MNELQVKGAWILYHTPPEKERGKTMRKEAKANKQAAISQIGGYHGGNFHNENYAFEGFQSNKYFTSDRYIALDAGFQRTDGKPLKGFGLEIETECSGIHNPQVLAEVLNKIIFPHFPADLFKLQRDGSLSGDTSAECITQIMTREFIRNNYGNFKLMYNTYFPAFGITCGPNCGMHVNISRGLFGRSDKAQTEAVRKLYYIVNKHYDLCCALFHRDRNRTVYCSRMAHSMDYCKSMDLGSCSSNHGVSFNLGHWNTGRIEIRLVGGQKNYACFRNTMECVFHLCDAVKTLTWADCDDLTKIFAGCNQYVFDRLKSYCRDSGTITAADLDKIRPTVQQVELI